MKTLIELYDDRPIENVLGTEMFRPERTVFLCPPEIAGNVPLHGRTAVRFVPSRTGKKGSTISW